MYIVHDLLCCFSKSSQKRFINRSFNKNSVGAQTHPPLVSESRPKPDRIVITNRGSKITDNNYC